MNLSPIPIVVSVLLATGGYALAADPVEEAPTLPPVSEPIIDTSEWGGFYIGAYGSYNWFSPTGSVLGNADSNGFGGGGFAGYNWDWGNQIVTGVEGRVGFSDNDAASGGVTVDQNWDASLRGRLGYAYERSLIYSFAGLAVTGVEASAITGSDDQQLTGFEVGAGLETELFENITGRVEYGFTDYGSENFNLGAGGSQEIDVENQSLNIGLGFRF